uniref:Major facilitator superfamily (MFS) profile domain-containing protein n=1 Tax=Leersia perrieri TaxID=77586 RepID=A0A0D9XMY5_9ORYZ
MDRSSRMERQRRGFRWKAPAIILGFELLESIAFSGVALNLVVYLAAVLHGSIAFNAAHVDTWNGTTFIVPVIGAFLADSYWGKYRTILASLFFYLAGLVLLTVSAAVPSLRPAACSAPPGAGACSPATGSQFSVFFAALYLTSIGTGGVKSALLPFGAEQYEESNTDQEKKKQSFFSWFFGAINLGIFVAGTLVSWVEQNVSWALGFGIATLCLFLAAAAFLAGTPCYTMRRLPAGDTPIKSILRVLVAAFRNRNRTIDHLYEGGGSKQQEEEVLAHTEGLRCLDKAAAIAPAPAVVNGLGKGSPSRWELCRVSEVERVKVLARIVPIWLTCVLYAASLGQMTTTFIQQGMAMDTRVFGGSFKVPVASLVSIEVVFMLLWVLLHDVLVMPLARRFRPAVGLTQLQRMGVGRVLVVLSMATAALVERRRLRGERRSMNIAWQLPQFIILAGSDVFSGIAQLEFFYGEAPASMRSICSAFSFLALSLGFYVNSLVVTLVAKITKRHDGSGGWLAPNLDDGHLDYYFWLWAIISAANLALYLLLAARYKSKTPSPPPQPNSPSHP